MFILHFSISRTANLGYTKVYFRIYRSLKTLFYCYYYFFSSPRMTFAKNLFGTETSIFQVTFYPRADFYNWYFSHYRYFILRLIRVTYTKFWWNEIASSTCHFTWIFQREKTFAHIFKPVFFTRKMSVKKRFYFNGLLFLTRWSYGYHFLLVLRYLTVLFKRCSFAILVNIRQKHDKLNVKSTLTLKIHDLRKLYGLFKGNSFSWTLQNLIRAL